MNEGGPISEFFYNLIPGSLFLLALDHQLDFRMVEFIVGSRNDALVISFYIIGGLSIGFFFQCLTKTVRKLWWNENAFKTISDKEDNIDELKETRENLKLKGNKNKIFFYMDNYLRGYTAAFLPTHFSSRFSFWSNITWGSFFLVIMASIYSSCLVMLCFLFLVIFSGIMANWHLENYYDTIFKTFYMRVVRKDLDNPKS